MEGRYSPLPDDDRTSSVHAGTPHPATPQDISTSELLNLLLNLNNRLQLLETRGVPTSIPVSTPKVSLPERFSGHISKCRDFIIAIENVFALQPNRYPTDQIKTRFVGTLLSNEALAWFRDVVENKPFLLDCYENFITELRNLFDDPNAKRHACAALKRLRQGKGSVLTYSSKFRRLAAETGYNDDALMDLFRYGLNDEVKDVLSTVLEEPSDLESYMNFCIRIDQRLYDRRIEKGSSSKASPMTHLPVEILTSRLNLVRICMHRENSPRSLNCSQIGQKSILAKYRDR